MTRLPILLVAAALLVPAPSAAQGTVADYQRAMALREKYRNLAVGVLDGPRFVEGTSRLQYRRTVRGGHEFIVVDAATQQRSRAFDHARGRGGRGGGGLAGPVRPPFEINGGEAKKSPDGRFEALVSNYNVALREAGSRDATMLSTDGSEGSYYDLDSLAWSPDSRKIAVYKVRPGFRRFIHYVESSPEDQLQPKQSTMQYAKPGDVLDVEQPVIFDVESKAQRQVDNALFPNAYDMSRLDWRKDSRAVTFEYNQRGHQVFRIIEIAADGRPRVVISEEPRTFFAYSSKKFRHDVADGKEVVWMSERDGWNHLYLYDGVTGAVKNQITMGNWPVRSVVKVDEEKRQIWFSASGMQPGTDPYFVHY